jgi:hypothetical protein
MMGGRFSRFLGVVLTLGLAISALVFLFAVMDEGRSINNPMPLVTMLGGAVVFFALWRGPIGRAIAKMLEGEAPADDQLGYRVEDLELKMNDLAVELQRLGELEERVEFSERLLARRTEAQGGEELR